MRTAIGAIAVNIAKPTNLSACMIDAFLSQQRQTTNLRIQGNGMEQEGHTHHPTDHPDEPWAPGLS
ncbi:hypothetical protein RN10_0457 [Mycobacterium tuberculosis]|nr:hypothetical protein RN10_0457 [Mycobacterium tuberculosis]